MNLKEIMKNRFLFLFKLYEEEKKVRLAASNIDSIEKELQLKSEEIDDVITYLKRKRLAVIDSKKNVKITPKGYSEIETAFKNPDEKTDHFLAANSIEINDLLTTIHENDNSKPRSPVSAYSTQYMELDKILQAIRKVESKFNLQPDLHAELICEIKTIECQLESPKPKKVILTISLKNIGSILEKQDSVVLPKYIQKRIVELLTYGL